MEGVIGSFDVDMLNIIHMAVVDEIVADIRIQSRVSSADADHDRITVFIDVAGQRFLEFFVEARVEQFDPAIGSVVDGIA